MIQSILLYSTISLIIILIALYIIIYAFTHKPRKAFPSELKYKTNDNTEILHPLPEKLSPSQDNIELSLVIPCYNETKRLKIMLDDAITYLKKTYNNNFEILIVDDGSKDDTSNYALELATSTFHLKPGQLRVIQFVKNRGKGGAVTHGVQFARGSYIIFADADGASKFSDLDKLMQSIKTTDLNKPNEIPAVTIGSRAHMVNTDAVVKRSFIRNFLMYGLHTLVYIFGIKTIKDTQCGFKLFNKASVREIFPYMHTEGWIFDVEILIIAIRKRIQINEIQISWHEVDGSKMDLARDSINMAVDLVVTRMAYLLKIYSDSSNKLKDN
ncbi:hypothetical protein B5S32_g1947 [[Candida] boidinii]|nr:hypothetical protein B5S32_g1947 [[Candida] boidinii]